MIGVFDSGIGGLTLLVELQKTLPNEDFVYYADTKNVPYSYKTPEQIIVFVEDAVIFLREKGCKAIVLACNTATNVCIEYLRAKYDFPIVAIQPAIKVAFDRNENNQRILACATPVTLKADRFNKLIDSLDINHLVDRVPLPGLVEFAEKNQFDSKEVLIYLHNEFRTLNLNNYKFIVLGCTHFTFFEKLIEQNFPPLMAVDGNVGTAKHLKNVLHLANLLKNNNKESGKLFFYESGIAMHDSQKYLTLMALIKK